MLNASISGKLDSDKPANKIFISRIKINKHLKRHAVGNREQVNWFINLGQANEPVDK